jgi:hypothetical protein
VAPDRTVVHQAMLENDLLAPNAISAPVKTTLPEGIDGAPWDGWGILVCLAVSRIRTAKAERHCGDDGAPPPRRERPFCSLRRCGHDEVILALMACTGLCSGAKHYPFERGILAPESRLRRSADG